MARTGRFGRLPTAAPDLSSQIVSMMEQWQNAEDTNILDAWQNGGKYKGKKVTDKRILDYYKDRRNSYDKDDPEWTEWNNDIWQMRFQIADQKVRMNYSLGKIGEAAVAKHYRTWAKKMPKNSEFYRNLMASAGQFEVSSGSGRAAAGKSYDYAAMQRRLESWQEPIDKAGRFLQAIDAYAMSMGYIQQGQTVEDMGIMQSDDFQMLMVGMLEHHDMKAFKEYMGDYLDLSGNITWDRLERLNKDAIAALKQQIRIYKQAPSDYSSNIQGLRNQINVIRSTNKYDERFSAYEKYVRAREEWNTDRADAENPQDFLAPNGEYEKSLNAIYKELMDAGMVAEAGDVAMEIASLNGDVTALQGTDNAGLWQKGNGVSTDGLQAEAEKTNSMMVAVEALTNGTAFIYTGEAKEGDLAVSLGAAQVQGFSVRPFSVNPNSGKPVMPGEGYMVVPERLADGTIVSRVIEGLPIYDANNVLLGYRGEYMNYPILKLRDAQDPTDWDFTDQDIFMDGTVGGVRMSFDGEKYLVEADEGFAYGDMRVGLDQTSPAAILDSIFGAVLDPAQLPPDSSQALKDKVQKDFDERQDQTEAIENWRATGVDVATTDLPEEIIGLDTGMGTDSLVTEELKAIFSIADFVGKYEDPEAAQRVAIRDFLRNAEGVDIPINDEDRQYMDSTGRMKPTLEGGQPIAPEAQESVAPDTVEATQPVEITQPQAEGAAPVADITQPVPERSGSEWRVTGDPNWWTDTANDPELFTVHLQEQLALVERQTNTFSSAAMVVVANAADAGNAYTADEMVSVAGVAEKDSAMSPFGMSVFQQEYADEVQLSNLEPTMKNAVKASRAGDPFIGVVASQFGAIERQREEIEKFGPVDAYYDQTGQVNPRFAGPAAPGTDPNIPGYIPPESWLPQPKTTVQANDALTAAETQNMLDVSKPAPAPASQTPLQAPYKPSVTRFKPTPNIKVGGLTVPRTPAAPNVSAPRISATPTLNYQGVPPPPVPKMAPGGSGGIQGPVAPQYAPTVPRVDITRPSGS